MSLKIGNTNIGVVVRNEGGGGGETPLTIDKTVQGTEIHITDNYNSDIKNIKVYGKEVTTQVNLFDINNFAWVGEPGYIIETGIWTPSGSKSNTLPTFATTQMKIPVIAGHSYTFSNLPARASNSKVGIQWFSSGYTAINTSNTTTAQANWIGRDVDAYPNGTATVTAPENAAYCELMVCDTTTTYKTGTTYYPATTEGLITSCANVTLYDNDATITTTELGTLYINDTKTTTNAQSVDLSSVTLGANTDYIYKNNNTWYSNVSGTDTELGSTLQTALNGLELSTTDGNYIWSSINNNLEVTYSIENNIKTKKNLKILLLSNSYGQDSFSYVPSIINRLAGNDVDITIGILYIGSCSLERHWDEINNNTSAYKYFETSNNEAWANGVTSTALSKLTKEDWDLFVFNQASTYTVDETSFSPYLNNIINWVFTNANKPVKIGMFFGGTRPDISDYTIDTLYEAEIPILQDVLDEYPIEIFFPNGTAIQNARTNNTLDALGTTGHLLYDNVHAQEGIPCLIEAYTVVLGLLKMLGLEYISIVGDKPTITDTWVTSMNIPGKHGSVVGMTNSNILLAQKSAIMAHKKPFEVSTIE